MATSNRTRHASGARGGADKRIPAVLNPAQLGFVAALPGLHEDGLTSVRHFAESVYLACPKAPIRYDHCTPVLYAHDGDGFRVASPLQILEQAQMLISQRFHRNAPLIDKPGVVRALLHTQLAAHPYAVFAALFLNRHHRLIGLAELFRGGMDDVEICPSGVVREALRRNSQELIAARNDPTGDGRPSAQDMRTARRLRDALSLVEIRLVDYLIVGETIASFAERGLI